MLTLTRAHLQHLLASKYAQIKESIPWSVHFINGLISALITPACRLLWAMMHESLPPGSEQPPYDPEVKKCIAFPDCGLQCSWSVNMTVRATESLRHQNMNISLLQETVLLPILPSSVRCIFPAKRKIGECRGQSPPCSRQQLQHSYLDGSNGSSENIHFLAFSLY